MRVLRDRIFLARWGHAESLAVGNHSDVELVRAVGQSEIRPVAKASEPFRRVLRLAHTREEKASSGCRVIEGLKGYLGPGDDEPEVSKPLNQSPMTHRGASIPAHCTTTNWKSLPGTSRSARPCSTFRISPAGTSRNDGWWSPGSPASALSRSSMARRCT